MDDNDRAYLKNLLKVHIKRVTSHSDELLREILNNGVTVTQASDTELVVSPFSRFTIDDEQISIDHNNYRDIFSVDTNSQDGEAFMKHHGLEFIGYSPYNNTSIFGLVKK